MKLCFIYYSSQQQIQAQNTSSCHVTLDPDVFKDNKVINW